MSTSPGTENEANLRGDATTKRKRKTANPVAARFSCPQCQRSFGRVEHLKRHLGSHTEDRPFKCQTCNKAFLRSDTLQRHEVIHDESHNQTKPKGARACFECASAKVKCNNNLPCARCTSKALDCKYPADAVAGPQTSTSLPTEAASDLDMFRVQLPSAEVAIGPSLRTPLASSGAVKRLLPSISAITGSGIGSGPFPAPVANTWEQSTPTSEWMTAGFTPPNGLERTGLTPNALFTGLGETELTLQQSPHQKRQQYHYDDTSSHDDLSNGVHRRWLDTVTQNSPAQSGLSTGSRGSQVQLGTGQYYTDSDGARLSRATLRGKHLPSRSGIGDSTMFASPSVASAPLGFMPVAVPRREEPLESTIVAASVDEATYQEIRSAFEQLCIHGDVSYFRPFESTFFPSLEDFQALLGLYAEDASEMLPIIHLPTLDLATSHWTLPLAMAAIGSQFLDGEVAVRDSYAMQELLHRTFLMLEENMDPALDGLDVCTSKVLHCLGMAYSGHPLLMQRAFRMHGKLADQCDTVWLGDTNDILLPEGDDDATTEQAWREWAGQERRRRVCYAIWLLDSMMYYHHQRRPVLVLEDVLCPLPCAEVLWEARPAAHWKQVLQCSAPEAPLPSALRTMFHERKLQATVGEFSRALIVHGLYRRTWEACSYLEQPLTYWTPTVERKKVAQITPDVLWIPGVATYRQWRNETCDCLDILHWAANSVIGAAAGLEHPTVAHLHLSRVVLLTPLETIRRFAATIAGYEPYDVATVAKLRAALRQWTQADHYKARLAMIHAGVQFWHLRKFSVGAFYEPHAILLSSLALWAYGMFTDNDDINRRLAEVRHTEDESALPISISLDRPADDELVQIFVRRGSKMAPTISGIGDVCAVDGPQKVLLEGMKLLGGLTTWGAAEPAMRLLEALCELPRDAVLAEPG